MIAYIALLILFINLLLRVFHGKQNHGRIVSGLLWDLWIFSCVAVDEIRCMIEELASFVLAVCTALLALLAMAFLYRSLKLIGITVYFLYCRIMEIDDLTTLLWDRACDAVAATLAVALVVWTVYSFFYFVYDAFQFVVTWLLLLKRKCFCRGSVRWRPAGLKNLYGARDRAVPTGVAAPKVLRDPKYTTKIPVLSDRKLDFALRRIDENHDKLARQYRQRHLEWLPDEELIKHIFVDDLPPIPTGRAAKRVLRRPRYTHAIPVLNDEQLAVAMLEFARKQDRYIRECRAHPRYDHWRGWVRTPAAIEPVKAIVAPVDAVVEGPIADHVVAAADPIAEEEVVPVDVVVDVREEPDDALDVEVPTNDSEDPVDDGLLQHDTILEGEGEEEPLADPAAAVDNNSVAEEEVVPVADEEPDDTLNDPPDVEAPTDDSKDPVDDGSLQHDTVLEGGGEEEPLADPAVAVDNNSVAEEEVVPASDEEPDDVLNDPPDVEEPMDDLEEPVDDGPLQHAIIRGEDQDLENAELSDEDADPVDVVAVVTQNEEKAAHPVSLRRSPGLGGATGSIFLSSNAGRAGRRSARIMSRR